MARDDGWKELSESLAFGGVPMRRQKETFRVLRNGELKHLNVGWNPTNVDCGLRPIVGDYWGVAVKTRKNPAGIGLDRYCGIHEVAMSDGFRKSIGKHGSTIHKCVDCDFQDLFPPKVNMDKEMVWELLKPHHSPK